MSQTISQRVVNSFVRGLVTEANELTFPENASIDELNCDLQRNGSRRRRKAVSLEAGAVSSNFTLTADDVVSAFVWENVGEQAGLDFLVVHSGTFLYFYELVSANVSSNQKGFSVDLSTYNVANDFSISSSYTQFVVIKGSLIVVSPAFEAISVQYVQDTDSLATTLISFRARDFGFIGPSSNYSIRIDMSDAPTSANNLRRKYDTYNAGWGDDQLTLYSDNFSTAEDVSDGGYQAPTDNNSQSSSGEP